MTKRTQKERREAKKRQPLNEKTEQYDLTYNENNETECEDKDQTLLNMGVGNATGREINEREFNMLMNYLKSQRRTIKFNGDEISEITNLKDDIICLDHNFVNHMLCITGTAMSEENDDLHIEFVHQWMSEQSQKNMFIKLDENDNAVSFAVIHRTDFDPLRKHGKPYIIDYIYTYSKYRENGHATSLIKRIKQEFQSTAFCSTYKSCHLFEKCGFKFNRSYSGSSMFRYP